MIMLKTVYDDVGECLGDAFVDLAGLQNSSLLAILQIIELDEAVDKMNYQINELAKG